VERGWTGGFLRCLAARTAGLALLCCLAAPVILRSQTMPDSRDPIEAVRSSSPISDDRILGVIPNFQTVTDPTKPYTPLRIRDKWKLFVKESVDPYTFTSAAFGAALSQIDNDDPRYGHGVKPYLQRFGAAQADFTTQNFFSDAILASLFHEDPRYFRKGPGTPVVKRIVYAMSRVVITRRDSGRDGFSFSGVMGMGMGIALSDAYYPPGSVGGGELESRVITSLTSSALGNLLPEFWPDIRAKIASHRRHQVETASAAGSQ
jgi:hypothetical protein